MAIPHALPGDVIDIRPLGDKLAQASTHTLAKSERIELIRLVVPAGKEILPHKVAGPITVQCLEGRIAFSAAGKEQQLSQGEMLFLLGNELHSLKGIENSSVLVTIQLVEKR